MTARGLKDRLLRRSHPEPFSGCLLWGGAVGTAGYGNISAGVSPKKIISTHRASWLVHVGPIPDGAFVLHRCDTRLCVNPDHLFLGSHVDNMRDMRSKGRSVRGEKQHSARLTETDVRVIRGLSVYGMRRERIAEIFGISPAHAWKIITRKKWAHVDADQA